MVGKTDGSGEKGESEWDSRSLSSISSAHSSSPVKPGGRGRGGEVGVQVQVDGFPIAARRTHALMRSPMQSHSLLEAPELASAVTSAPLQSLHPPTRRSVDFDAAWFSDDAAHALQLVRCLLSLPPRSSCLHSLVCIRGSCRTIKWCRQICVTFVTLFDT